VRACHRVCIGAWWQLYAYVLPAGLARLDGQQAAESGFGWLSFVCVWWQCGQRVGSLAAHWRLLASELDLRGTGGACCGGAASWWIASRREAKTSRRESERAPRELSHKHRLCAALCACLLALCEPCSLCAGVRASKPAGHIVLVSVSVVRACVQLAAKLTGNNNNNNNNTVSQPPKVSSFIVGANFSPCPSAPITGQFVCVRLSVRVRARTISIVVP